MLLLNNEDNSPTSRAALSNYAFVFIILIERPFMAQIKFFVFIRLRTYDVLIINP